MAEASIPVDLFNPGQVFASLGFLEASDVLLGDAEGRFDWSDESDVRFALRASGDENPVAAVFKFLAGAAVKEVEPLQWPGKTSSEAIVAEVFPSRLSNHFDKQEKKWTRTKLPIRLVGGNNDDRAIDLVGWADGSSRPSFKLYSGNRSAHTISRDMLSGKRKKPNKKNRDGKVERSGIRQLLEEGASKLAEDPFNLLCSMAGSFNFDPRGAWTALDAGFSPDQQKKAGNIAGLSASPVVELTAAWGLEHARPDEYETRQVRYHVWGDWLPPMLARPALAGAALMIPRRSFRFTLNLSGKNKVVTFAQEEPQV